MEPITRQDAIRRQLDTAILLWFQDGDSVSTHTLACSALKIIEDVGRKFGKRTMLFEKLPKELVKDSTNAQNFFKHAKDDPHRVLEFNHSITQFHIYDAAQHYKTLYLHLTPLMTTFIIRFLLLQPGIGTVEIPASLPVSLTKGVLTKMSNDEFFAAVMPALNR